MGLQCSRRRFRPFVIALAVAVVTSFMGASPAWASEADLILPDLRQATFGPFNGYSLLLTGMLICVAGLVFGLVIYSHLKRLPVHRSMLEVSELIYETCKT